MLVKDIKKSKYFTSMDKTFLTELLHPKNEDIKMGCSIAHAVLKPGKSSLPHRVRSVEVYYLLEGKGTYAHRRRIQGASTGAGCLHSTGIKAVD
jgi:mannose-6-phosphate isomerase-like protein (cupin superfamily)